MILQKFGLSSSASRQRPTKGCRAHSQASRPWALAICRGIDN